MGVKQKHEATSGLVVDDAYFRIQYIYGDKNMLYVDFATFVSRNHALEGRPSISINTYSFVPDVRDNALNFYRQAYAYIKRREEFKNAVDVLEEGQVPLVSFND